MALSPEYIARGFNQALGMVLSERERDIGRGRGAAGVGVSAITRRLYDNNRTVPGANYSSYAAVVRRAVAAALAAEEMNANAAYAPQRAQIPEVPTLYANTERYRYQVITRASRGGGKERSVRGEVVSDSPLSYAQVEDDVRRRVDYADSPFRARKSPLARLSGADAIIGIDIIAVTRIY